MYYLIHLFFWNWSLHPSARQLGEDNQWERGGYSECLSVSFSLTWGSSLLRAVPSRGLCPQPGALYVHLLATSPPDLGWGLHCCFWVPWAVAEMTWLLWCLWGLGWASSPVITNLSSLLWACVIFPTFPLCSLLFLRPGNCPVLAPSLIPTQRRFAHCFLQCLYCLDFYLINFFTVFVFFLRVPYVSGMVWILLPQNSYGPGVMPLGGRAPGRRLGHEGSVWPHECILCPYKRGPRELHHVRTQGADGHLWARK